MVGRVGRVLTVENSGKVWQGAPFLAKPKFNLVTSMKPAGIILGKDRSSEDLLLLAVRPSLAKHGKTNAPKSQLPCEPILPDDSEVWIRMCSTFHTESTTKATKRILLSHKMISMNQQIEQQQQQHAWPGVLGKQGCWKRMHWTDWITSHQIYKILQTTHYSSLFIIIHHYSSLFIIIHHFFIIIHHYSSLSWDFPWASAESLAKTAKKRLRRRARRDLRGIAKQTHLTKGWEGVATS